MDSNRLCVSNKALTVFVLMEPEALFTRDILDIMSNSEDTVDSFLLTASDLYEIATPSTNTPMQVSATPSLGPPAPPSSSTRFAAPVTEQQILRASQAAITKKTKRDTRYCLNTYAAWKHHTEQRSNITIAPLEKITK